jgi:phosphoglycolate phosphatase-like HAD superfamily hydrolase
VAPTKLVLALDLDGTLIDARVRQVGVAAEALIEVSGSDGRLDERRFWRLKRAGATTAGALEHLGYPPAVSAAVAARWLERIESDAWLERDRSLPGVRGAVAALHDRVVVLTARRRPPGAARSIAAAGLDSLIDEVVVVDPANVVAEKARALRRLRPVAFIGDTDSDGRAAASAGVPFAAVSTGQRSASYLRAQGFEPARSLRIALGSLSASRR